MDPNAISCSAGTLLLLWCREEGCAAVDVAGRESEGREERVLMLNVEFEDVVEYDRGRAIS